MENMRGAYKILLLALWSLELVLLLVSLLILRSGSHIGWVFLFLTFFSYVIMVIFTAIAIYTTSQKGK